MRILRTLLSDGQATQAARSRGFARNDRVHVAAPIDKPGTVVRVRDEQYTVKLDTGSRCYVTASMLRELETASGTKLRIRRAKSETPTRVGESWDEGPSDIERADSEELRPDVRPLARNTG